MPTTAPSSPGQPRAGRYIRASELGEHAFCRRAWWLHHVRGVEPDNAVALAEGTAAHAVHGRTVRSVARLRRLAFWLVGLGLALAVLAAAGALAR
jgi:hypothetical protein